MEQVARTIQLSYARKLGLTGKGITIAYLDTGISYHHDFRKPYNRILCFKDFVNKRNSPYDDNGHGTHVAGIGSSSRIGIAPGSNILALKVLDRYGNGMTEPVIECFKWLMKYKNVYHIRIINLSLGMSKQTSLSKQQMLSEWVNRLWDYGFIVCISGGNLGPHKSSITIPGNSRKIITVGSSDDMDEDLFSGRGPTEECIVKPDLVAPGTDIMSCYSSSHYIERSGTSMSTPMVSGAIALYLEKHPASSNKDIKFKLRSSCDDLGFPPNTQGWGRINIKKLLTD